MAKMTVAEVLKDISAPKKDNGDMQYKKFNKKSFNKLMTAIANDVDFTTQVVSSSKGEIKSKEELRVTEGFRKWVQGVVEAAGIDPKESGFVLSDDFEIKNTDGLYEFFVTVVWEFLQSGNRFSLIDKEDFSGSLYLKNVPETTVVKKDAKNPITGEVLGDFETKTQAHKTLAVKSSCPKWLKSRMKIS